MISKEAVKISFENYLAIFPEEESFFSLLIEQIQLNEDTFSRKNFRGHITASGLVISSNKKVLAIFHNKLQKYLQPGGHIENTDESLEDSAQREVFEEAGLNAIKLHPWHSKTRSPILIDTHPIPENMNKQEDAHYHHDFMFIFSTENIDISLDQNEVSDFKWTDIDLVIQDESNMARAIRKMKEFAIL